MGHEYAGGIYLVTAVSEGGYTEYWAAAVPTHEAIEAVRSMMHPDRKLTLTERGLPARVWRD